jgi:hypothetical protein
VDFETHCTEKHKEKEKEKEKTPPPPKRPFEVLEKWISDEADKLAGNPEFFIKYRNNTQVEALINKKAKLLVEDEKFVSEYIQTHPETIATVTKQRAESLILNHIKAMEQNK